MDMRKLKNLLAELREAGVTQYEYEKDGEKVSIKMLAQRDVQAVRPADQEFLPLHLRSTPNINKTLYAETGQVPGTVAQLRQALKARQAAGETP